MTNYEIADQFTLLSKLMDIHGENSFRAKSYSIAAFNIEKLPAELSALDDATIFSMKGIGDATGKKIRELLDTGKLEALEQMLLATPPGIVEMMQIKGLGPKKIAVIWKELSVESIGELEYACNENRLVSLKGFGAKTQENILKIIAFIRANQGYHLWAEAHEVGKTVLNSMQKAFPDAQVFFTGELNRQLEVVSKIEFATDLDKDSLTGFLQNFNDIQSITETEEDGIQTINVHVKDFPSLCFYLSGKQALHHTLFRKNAGEDFLKAFETSYVLNTSAANEEEIFSSNNLQFIPSPLRENPAILAKAAAHKIEKLIEPSDIKGIIHSHSSWSDGSNTIEEMAKAAIEMGFEYLVLSDHSQAAFYANGLTPERIAAQHQEIDALNEKLKPFKIFKSIEADILYDGSLDYNNQVLATFDLVIASVHSILKMTEEKAMERVIKAIENPYTTILGHPTGRLLLSREGYPLDHKKIIDACAANNVVIEINAHPRRLDIDWRWIEYAMEKGVLLSIDPDAHTISGFKDVFYGVMAGQKGGLTAQQNLSSFSLSAFEDFLSKRKK